MKRRPLLFAALVAFAIGSLAACSSEASTRTASASDGPTTATTAVPVTVPETIPPGTTLRLGDQLEYLQTVLREGGQDKDFGYKIEYSSFVGGPPMLQAFKGGAVDAGFVASTPLLFAQAGGQKITAVAGWASPHGSAGLLTVDDSIKGWKDLEGKRVAYQRGTSLEAGILVGLSKAGLKPSDITTVDVPFPQINAALQGGSADAAISSEPLISGFIASHPEARVVASADAITDRASFLIASDATLADPAKTAALADYATRLVRAYAFLVDHPEVIADSVYVKTYGLTPERARAVVEHNGPTRFLDLPGDIVGEQQKLADLFVAAGQLPEAIDVRSEFDTRFNDLVTKAQAK